MTDLAVLDVDQLREQLRATAHELMRRTDRAQQPYVWYLPHPSADAYPKAYKRARYVEILVNDHSIVTRLDEQERWGLIAWLIAQDPLPAQEARTKTTT